MVMMPRKESECYRGEKGTCRDKGKTVPSVGQ